MKENEIIKPRWRSQEPSEIIGGSMRSAYSFLKRLRSDIGFCACPKNTLRENGLCNEPEELWDGYLED